MPLASAAPNIWATMYITAFSKLIWQLASKPSVTAGFRWAPLMWPRLWARVAMDKPNARATLTSWSGLSLLVFPTAAVMLRKMKRVIPTSSAKTALQNALLFSSFMTGSSGHADVLVWGFLRALSMFLCQKRVFIGQVLLMKQGAGLSYGGRKSEWERGEEAGRIDEKSLVFLPPCQFYKSTSQRRA